MEREQGATNGCRCGGVVVVVQRHAGAGGVVGVGGVHEKDCSGSADPSGDFPPSPEQMMAHVRASVGEASHHGGNGRLGR
eukprot:5451235-Lingulodinium_polyedra.AAC.1